MTQRSGRIAPFSVAPELFTSDNSVKVNFPRPTNDDGYGFRSCWATVLKQFSGSDDFNPNEDHRRRRVPLSVVNWVDGCFLSELQSTTI
jgi:hypothetical protein